MALQGCRVKVGMRPSIRKAGSALIMAGSRAEIVALGKQAFLCWTAPRRGRTERPALIQRSQGPGVPITRVVVPRRQLFLPMTTMRRLADPIATSSQIRSGGRMRHAG
jgi:hypothetical protein